MTEATEGQHLKLSQFGTLCDVIMAICYREKGVEYLHVSVERKSAAHTGFAACKMFFMWWEGTAVVIIKKTAEAIDMPDERFYFESGSRKG